MDREGTSTKDQLADALEALMEAKPLDDIRVTEVIDAVGTSRQTFYRHFHDKYDLMEYCYLRMYENTFGKMNKYYPFSAACADLYDLFRKKQSFLKAAFQSHDVNNLTAVAEKWVRSTYARYLALQGVKDAGDVAFALDLMVIGGVELTKRWVLEGMTMPNDQLIRYWKLSAPQNIARYFS